MAKQKGNGKKASPGGGDGKSAQQAAPPEVKTYLEGTRFPGWIGRTYAESEPAFPVPAQASGTTRPPRRPGPRVPSIGGRMVRCSGSIASTGSWEATAISGSRSCSPGASRSIS